MGRWLPASSSARHAAAVSDSDGLCLRRGGVRGPALQQLAHWSYHAYVNSNARLDATPAMQTQQYWRPAVLFTLCHGVEHN